ncbi:MAG: dihydroorotate dehydrogenase [Muribaculaceae bacterium]|nr:dihydroorotate dehydrogenase [Muribaculaceae bacterium]MDE7141647.1 dihydroorotate dehydrogenase [Muribaculaceae bacterium]
MEKNIAAPELGVRIGSLKMANPVMTASGTFGYGEEFADLLDISSLGAYIVKGTTLNPRQGNDYPRMAETPSGMLNAVGLQNKGVDYFASDIYPRIRRQGSNLIVNISGNTPEEYAEAACRLAALDDVAALEVNISCPNVKQGGLAFGTTTEGAGSVTRAVRAAWPRTLIVKLSPNVTDITEIARAVEAEGADSVSLINTLMGMAVDVERRRPCLSTVTGGLSGPAVRPVAVRMVWQTAKAVKIPVIGLGGIASGRDAMEFILAGATAVQVGTANFLNPAVCAEIIDYMADYCRRHNVASIADLVGALEA